MELSNAIIASYLLKRFKNGKGTYKTNKQDIITDTVPHAVWENVLQWVIMMITEEKVKGDLS